AGAAARRVHPGALLHDRSGCRGGGHHPAGRRGSAADLSGGCDVYRHRDRGRPRSHRATLRLTMLLPEVCVTYLLRESPTGTEVLLGRKKFGLGEGNLVGPGGKLDPGESPADAAVREVFEEVSISIRP